MEKPIKPIMPYYGGKRKLAPMISKIIKANLSEDSTYYEPFVGGGAVWLYLEHKKSVIGDIVPDLINLYECIKEDPQKVIDYYKRLPNSKTKYYQIRNMDRNPNFKLINKFFKAARFLYLCKTGFGSCRFNQKGQANQSYFQHPDLPIYCPEKDILRMHRLLQNTKVNLESFDETIKDAKAGDVVYLDPPYIDTRYDQYWIEKFKHSDMKRLKTHCDELDKKGVKFILSHSSNEFVNELYQDYKIISLSTKRDIKFTNTGKNRYDDEVIITNIDYIPDLENSSTVTYKEIKKKESE